MNVNPIATLNSLIKTPNFKGKNQAPKLDYTIQDTVNFTKKKSEDDVIHGANYDELKNIDTSRTRTIPELKRDIKDGKDVSSDRAKLILSRVNKALSDAEIFAENHPEFDKDDIKQDLIRIVVEKTTKNLNSNNDTDTFNQAYQYAKENYFSKLLENSSREIPATIKKDRSDIDPIEIIEKEELKNKINNTINGLHSTEAVVLRMYYGLDGEDAKSVKEIADNFSVSPERIRKILMKAEKKLQFPPRKKELEKFL